VSVLSVRWVGTAADEYDAMVSFLRDGLGLRVRFEEVATVELETADGDRVQVFGAGHRYHAFFRAHARGPVPLFEVEDLADAKRSLEAAGAETIGAPERDAEWEWIHVRAPDGNLYEVASRLG
jgi:catechol 2,3-dioxygenase-like lactoylglutathione lyase family enzyme